MNAEAIRTATFLFGLLLFIPGTEAQSSSDKALSIQKVTESDIPSLKPGTRNEKRISDEEFLENVDQTFRTFCYRPIDEKSWARTICMRFSIDGRYLCIGENNSEWKRMGLFGDGYTGTAKESAETRLWDLQSGQLARRFSGHKEGKYIQSVSIPDDARWVATSAFEPYGSRIQMQIGIPMRVPSGEDVKLWDRITGEELYYWPEAGVHAEITPDGNAVITVGTGQVSAWETAGKSRSPVWQTRLDCYLNAAPLLSRDGSLCVVSTGDRLAVIDTKTGKVVRQTGDAAHESAVSEFALDNDARVLVTVDRRNILVWDFNRGSEIRRLPLSDDYQEVVAIHIREAEPVVQAVTRNGWFLEWDIRTGESLRSVNLTRNASVNAEFAASGNVAAIAHSESGTVDLVNLTTGEFQMRLHNLHEERQWLCETAKGDMQAPPELINLEQLALAEKNLRNDPDAVREVGNAVVKGARAQIHVSRKNDSNSRRLFVLAVGVSQHKYSEYNLKYASRDARVLAETLQTASNSVFEEVFVQVYTDEEATSKSISEGLNWLARSSGPNDVAVILFSGHGVRGRNGLYFVPHEGDGESIQSTCLNWSNVARKVNDTQAGQILFLADCCHAGAFSIENRPTQDELVREIARKKGLLLFCSSTGEQKSLELEKLRQGVFTASFLEAFLGQADSDRNRSVTFGEIVQYVTNNVTATTNGSQTPSVPYPDQFDPSFILMQSK